MAWRGSLEAKFLVFQKYFSHYEMLQKHHSVLRVSSMSSLYVQISLIASFGSYTEIY